MTGLTVEKIIEIHDEIIRQYEGAQGILSESTLHFMIFRSNRSRDIFRKSAIALHAIGSQHPFVDGNKRTALVVAENILGRKGYYIAADEDTIVEFMLAVASYEYETGQVQQWLEEHVRKMKD